MCPEEPNSKLQQLFERFNRRYWRGRLPHYTVIVSDKYVGARCEKRDRIIYINPSIPPRSVPQFLLHEMAHAAVKGYAHGKLWRDEMERLIRLGAPLKGELAEYSPEAVPQTLASILPEFFDAAFLSDQTWREVWRHKAYGYGFTERVVSRTNTRLKSGTKPAANGCGVAASEDRTEDSHPDCSRGCGSSMPPG